jgi:hypothetical protein
MTRPQGARFVKAGTTTTAPAKSQIELERILRRYGASGFGVQSDYQARTIRVLFRVPDQPGSQAHVPIRLEVSIANVAQALGYRISSLGAAAWEQAERVAWRHLVLWVDAALSASSAGMQTMTEAFLAHAVVRNAEGQSLRFIEHMEGHTEGGFRALLAPPG